MCMASPPPASAAAVLCALLALAAAPGCRNLPTPTDDLGLLRRKFSDFNLDDADFVAFQAHTIGRAQCRFFHDRLYNFSGSMQPDQTMDLAYLSELRQSCPASDGDRTALSNLDNSYYGNIRRNRGLLQSDQGMLSAPGGDAAQRPPRPSSGGSPPARPTSSRASRR
ncbi:hypothetical protein ABZP36_006735 [Zizania latifolia]